MTKEKGRTRKRAAKTEVLRFGSVTIKARSSLRGDRRSNILEGQSALKRAGTQIIRAGVKIKVADDVPLFHADPDNPQQVVRILHGKRESGVFIKKKFIVRK